MRLLILFPLVFTLVAYGQDNKVVPPSKPELVDEFGPVGNDPLMFRVSIFENRIKDINGTGTIVLGGNSWQKHVNKQRIEGCHAWMKIPTDRINFLFKQGSGELSVEFWLIPSGIRFAPPHTEDVSYKLDDLTKPVEFTNSMALEEYCPRIFDLDLYAKFLIANPNFTGRVVINSKTNNDFLRRVSRYRKQLNNLQITSSRIRYFRHRFYGERDEQFWLIPSKQK